MTIGSLVKVESIAECSPWGILQYFWPALRDNWSWKAIFGLFESGRFTQVLLYMCWALKRTVLLSCEKVMILPYTIIYATLLWASIQNVTKIWYSQEGYQFWYMACMWRHMIKLDIACVSFCGLKKFINWLHIWNSGLGVIKLYSWSTEHEIYPAHKC